MRFAKKNTGTIVILWIGRNNIGNENLIWNWFGRSLTQKRCSYRRVGMGLHSSRNLGVHLTLFQPRGKIMPTSHITACPSDLKTYLHLCISNRKIHILFFQPRQNPTELSLPPVDSTSCNFMENRGQIAWLFWVVCNIWEERRAGQTMIDILTQTVVWRYEIHLCFDPQNELKYFLKKNSNILSNFHRVFLHFFYFDHKNLSRKIKLPRVCSFQEDSWAILISFKSVVIVCWNHNKVSKNDNTFERNEDCATVFLKCMYFSNCNAYLADTQLSKIIFEGALF